jgi:hypothetical protein
MVFMSLLLDGSLPASSHRVTPQASTRRPLMALSNATGVEIGRVLNQDFLN